MDWIVERPHSMKETCEYRGAKPGQGARTAGKMEMPAAKTGRL